MKFSRPGDAFQVAWERQGNACPRCDTVGKVSPIEIFICPWCLPAVERDVLARISADKVPLDRRKGRRMPCRVCGELGSKERDICDQCLPAASQHGIWTLVSDPSVPDGHFRCSECKIIRPIADFDYGPWGYQGACGRCTNWGWA